MEVKKFLVDFQNLEGVTVAERQKNFNKLLHRNKSLFADPVMSKDIIANLRAETYLEKQFRVEILLASRCVPELLEIFKNGNESLRCKIMKHKWFFKEAFRDMTASQIMDVLVPQLSYSVRIKLLKGLILEFENEELLSELFDIYKANYGLPAALPLLFGCTVDKIESVIKTDPVFLSRSKVIRLLRKAPDLFPVYVEEYIKHIGDCNHLFNDTKFMQHLASKYYEVYQLLKNKYQLTVCLGTKCTKRIFAVAKDKILAEPDKYVKDLKLNVFVRRLGNNGLFKLYFKSVFPKSVEDFYCDDSRINSLLSHYPKNKRYQLLKETFEEVYDNRLMDCPKKIDKSLLELACGKDDAIERSQMAEMMLHITSDADFAVYLLPAKAIPYLKREINSTNKTEQRKHLINLLVRTCKINNDMASLVIVIKYITARHRNKSIVVKEFLADIERLFDLHEFKKELWDVLIELVDFYFLMNPCSWDARKILLHFVEFKYSAGEPIKEYVAKFKARDDTGEQLFNHDCNNGEFLRETIKEFVALLLENDGCKDEFFYYRVFENLFHWNLRHPEFAVSYFDYPKWLEIIRKLADWDDHNYSMSYILCSRDRNVFVELMLEVFLRNHSIVAESKLVSYLFKWYPLMLLKHIHSFLSSQLKRYYMCFESLLRWMKRYDHLKIPETAVTFCQNRFCIEDKMESEVNYDRFFAILLRFMEPNEFLNYIAECRPKDLSLANWEPEEKPLYYVQSARARSFRFTEHPTNILPVVMGYCAGDFLLPILDVLYKCFHHVPCNILPPYLDTLAKGAVSVRKHALFLTCIVGDLESSKRILNSFVSSERNMSLQKRLALTALRCFLLHYSPDFWELVVTSIVLLDDGDKESFAKLVYPEKFIPKRYFSLYYQEIWGLVEKKNLNSSLKYALQIFMMRQIESSIDEFPTAFCYRVIDTLLLKFSNHSPYNSEINGFVCKFLLGHEDPNRFIRVITILESAKTSHADNVKLREKTKNEIGYFINRFCYFYHSSSIHDTWDKKLLKDFADQLLNLYNPTEIFSDYLLLTFTVDLIASQSLKDYVEEVSFRLDELVEKFGVHFLEDIRTAIWLTLRYFYRGHKTKNAVVEFIHELLSLKHTEVNEILCLLLLLYSEEDRTKSGFDGCLRMFEESTVPYIQISLKRRENRYASTNHMNLKH